MTKQAVMAYVAMIFVTATMGYMQSVHKGYGPGIGVLLWNLLVGLFWPITLFVLFFALARD